MPATRSGISTIAILMTFFAMVAMALIAANAWSRNQQAQVARAEAADVYVPADEDAPVTDAVIEKTAL